MRNDEDDDGGLIDGVGFAEEGGQSALRAATRRNPRNRPCPTCGAKNRLTRVSVAHVTASVKDLELSKILEPYAGDVNPFHQIEIGKDRKSVV